MQTKDEQWTFEELTFTGLAVCGIIAIALVFASYYITPLLNHLIWGMNY